MIDLFSIQTIFTTTVFTTLVCLIQFIKAKDISECKLGFILSIALLLSGILTSTYHFSFIIFLLASYLIHKKPSQTTAFFITVTAISTIGAIQTNFINIILFQFALTISFFLFYSKIIFKNSLKELTIRLDYLDYQNLKNENTLKDKLQALTPGVIKKSKIIKIDQIDESVHFKVSYEQ